MKNTKSSKKVKPITFTLPERIITELSKLPARSKSQFVKNALDFYLKTQKRKKALENLEKLRQKAHTTQAQSQKSAQELLKADRISH